MSIARKILSFLLLLLAFWASSCGTDQPRQPAAPARHLTAQLPPAAAQLPAPDSEANTAAGTHPSDQLQPIRANYQRINDIPEWSATAVSSLDEPGEGGEATFYYAHGRLEKVMARHFGEMSQQQATYYLLQGQPSFVLEQSYTYNRPMYYDSAAMRQAHDSEAFNFAKSAVSESRSYFAQGRLLQQLRNQKRSVPFTADYRKREQKRLITDFEAIMSAQGQQ